MKQGQKKYAISVKYMKKLKKYAKILEKDLYLAIKSDLPEYNFMNWSLVPCDFIENKAKKKKTRLHGGRHEKCYVIDILELYTNDYSGLILNNRSIMIPKGYKYIREYNRFEKSYIIDDEYGYMKKVIFPVSFSPSYARVPPIVLSSWVTYIIWIIPLTLIILLIVYHHKFRKIGFAYFLFVFL